MKWHEMWQVVRRCWAREHYPELHQQVMRDYHAAEAARKAQRDANYKQYRRMQRLHMVP